MKLRYQVPLIYHLCRGALNPTNPKHSAKAGAVLVRSGLIDQSVEEIQRRDQSGFLQKREVIIEQEIEFFQNLPEHSLGREYYHYMQRHQLQYGILGKVKVMNTGTYVEYLVRQTHDLWHFLTGFDTSIAGELGLQAFMNRQMNWPFSLLAIAGGCLITLFNNPSEARNLISSIVRGYTLADQVKPLILVDWNQYWKRPLADVRTELNL